MLLVDHQIKSLCELGLIEPYDPSLVNPSSLDIRIGHTAMKDSGLGFFDWAWKLILQDLSRSVNPLWEQWAKKQLQKSGFKYIPFRHYTKENPYWMRPNECLLLGTLERFAIPDNVSVNLKLKSSRAREGLSHALAGWVDPGFHGVLTLEIKNYSTRHCVPVYPGLRIGQIILEQHDTPESTYRNGRYAGHQKVIGSMG